MTNQDTTTFKNRQVIHKDINDVLPKISVCRRGAMIVYHTGFLCADIPSEKASNVENMTISNLRVMRSRMQDFQKLGLIELFQRKISNFVYEYLAYVK